MAAPDITEALVRDGAQAWVTSPEEFRDIIARKIPRWDALTRRANVRAE